MSRHQTIWLLVVAVLTTFAVLFCPSVRYEDLLALTSRQKVAIVGNSVIRTPSKCDHDTRGISSLMEEPLGAEVLDLSVGGQTLEQSIQLAGLALQNSDVRMVVLPLVLTSRLAGDGFDLQTWLFYRLADRDVASANLAQRIADRRFFAGEPPVNGAAFEFGGVGYPDYEGVKAQYFAKEHASMPCPENEGSDRRFVKAYYHFVYRAPGIRDYLMKGLEDLQKKATERRKRILFVLMPVNYDLLEELHPDLAAEMRRETIWVSKRLSTAGAEQLDLSSTVRSADFADAWCACGHMQQHARTETARSISSALGSAATPTISSAKD